ncbi:MAG: hypothetical protein A3B68_06680 [Candidatus Melainabacteria bacterium RIFCSPHIGHO2_02_FULL_34_12]|nr:MAG: hypothetical protein A3B68_06680 [Candidatus Melainabacteria bacterium RIFCSPHIGHO2_02_FULL_34_12]
MKLVNGILTDVWGSLQASFKLLWSAVSPILLPLILVLVVLVLGLWISGFLGNKIAVILKKAKIDDVLDKILFSHLSKLTGIDVSASALIGDAVKWFLTATVIITALDLAGLVSVIGFIHSAIHYLPSIFIAVLIVLVGALISDFVVVIVKYLTNSDKGHLITTSRLAVNLFALIAALHHLLAPLAGSFNHLLNNVLALTQSQTNALFIGLLVLILLASKNIVTKTVETLYK